MVNSRRYRSVDDGVTTVLVGVTTSSFLLSIVGSTRPLFDSTGTNDEDDGDDIDDDDDDDDSDDIIPLKCVSIRASKYGMSNASHIE